MANETRQPKATCTIAGESGAVHQVVLGSSINAFSWVQVKFHRKQTSAKGSKVLSEELIARLAAMQQGMFTTRDSPDLDLTIDDGNEGQLNFRGFIANPGLVAGRADISADVRAVHPASQVEALNLSIYTSPGTPTNLEKGNPESKVWTERLDNITDALIKRWQDSSAGSSGDESSIKQEIHSQNAKPLEMWKAILSESKDSTTQDSLEKAAEHPGVNRSINSFLANTLLATRPQFMHTMLSFNASLQMLYAPGMAPDEIGKFILTRKIFESQQEVTADMTEDGCQAGLGARSNLPMGQVLVLGIGGSNFMNFKNATTGDAPVTPTQKQKIVVRYPEQSVQGAQLISVPLPPFLPFPISLTPYQNNAIARELNALTTVKSMQDAAASLDAYINGSLSELCKDYARNIYIDLAISGSQFTINVPFNLKVRVGGYYAVSSAEGKLFTGLLAELQHVLTISENNASASTRLTFTYVEMNGFSLPGK